MIVDHVAFQAVADPPSFDSAKDGSPSGDVVDPLPLFLYYSFLIFIFTILMLGTTSIVGNNEEQRRKLGEEKEQNGEER